MLINLIPNTECISARISGNAKNIPICLKSAISIILSSTPSFLNIPYRSLLSALSDNSLNARIAALLIRNIIPKYKAINVTNAPSPTLLSARSILEFQLMKLFLNDIFFIKLSNCVSIEYLSSLVSAL